MITSSGRHSRAAKDQAKRRLDAQAKELAELNREAALVSSKSRIERQTAFRIKANEKSRCVVGTRASSRLRGAVIDEWQPIPHDWLSDIRPPSSKGLERQKTGLESGDESISDLTDLSEDSLDSVSISLKDEASGKEEAAERDDDDDVLEQGSEEFVEWQTVFLKCCPLCHCLTRITRSV